MHHSLALCSDHLDLIRQWALLLIGGMVLACAGPACAQGSADNTPTRLGLRIEPGSYLGQLQSEFRAVGEARFIYGGTADEATLHLQNGGETVEVQGQPFTKARKIVVTEQPKFLWSVNVQMRNLEPVRKGDALLLIFYARGKAGPKAVSTGEGALVQPLFKSDTWGSDFHARRELLENWERYWVKTEPVDKDYAPGQLELLIMLGQQPQTVEIGGVVVMAFPAGSNLQAMPEPVFTYAGREAEAPWRQEAERRIERYRKGDLRITVVDAGGKPVPGVQVQVTLKQHAFHFGTAVALDKWLGSNISAQDRDQYRRIVADHFNMLVPENALKWRGYTEWGARLEDTEALLKWGREHGFYNRGHVLVWPSWEHTPNAVQQRATILRPCGRRSAST